MPDNAHDPDGGAPVGRRIVLGLLGLGGLGIVFGSKVQNGLAKALGPIEEHDPTGLVEFLPFGEPSGSTRDRERPRSRPRELPPERSGLVEPTRPTTPSTTCAPCRRPTSSASSSASPAGGCRRCPGAGAADAICWLSPGRQMTRRRFG